MSILIVKMRDKGLVVGAECDHGFVTTVSVIKAATQPGDAENL